jgi:type VI protein secretion system component VasF
MMPAGLRQLWHLPKQVHRRSKEKRVPRWLLILGAVALIATIAGFVTFGGGDMGQ